MPSEPKDEPDLDAGWDELDSAPPASGGTPSSEPAAGPASLADEALDEVDAGWDEPELNQGAAGGAMPDQRRRKHRNREKKPAQVERAPVAIVKPGPSRVPSLKKVQRALDRKSREKAAAARADREQERKRRLELERRATLEQIMARAAAHQSEPADRKPARPKKPGRAEQARAKPSTVDRDSQPESKPSKPRRSKSEQEKTERKPVLSRKEKRARRRERRRRAARARGMWIAVATVAAIALGFVIWKMTR